MRKRAERERKEKELEARLRLKHFEDEKRERERKEREDRLNEEKEKLREKKEAMARDKLLGNVKKASRSRSPSYPGVNSGSRDELRKKRLPSDEEDEGISFLTREEKRERRKMAGLSSGAGRTKRNGAPQRSKKSLPGGGLDAGGAGQNSSGSPSQSVKARLAAMPNTLQKLNVNKRDTRTIDEIIRDREKSKEGRVLNGEQAKEFNDWFGKKKDTTGLANKTAALDISANDSYSGAPTSPNKPASSSTLNKKQSTASLPSFSKSKDSLRPSTSKPVSASRPTPTSRPPASGAAKPRPSSAHIPSSAGKKHRRSESFSEDEEEYDSPPSKKRYAPPAQDDYRSEIWKLFGKDRSSYVNDVVDSDEDDMEADAMDLEKEELRRFVVFQRLGSFGVLMVLRVWLVPALLGRKMNKRFVRRRCMNTRRGRRRWRRNVGKLGLVGFLPREFRGRHPFQASPFLPTGCPLRPRITCSLFSTSISCCTTVVLPPYLFVPCDLINVHPSCYMRMKLLFVNHTYTYNLYNVSFCHALLGTFSPPSHLLLLPLKYLLSHPSVLTFLEFLTHILLSVLGFWSRRYAVSAADENAECIYVPALGRFGRDVCIINSYCPSIPQSREEICTMTLRNAICFANRTQWTERFNVVSVTDTGLRASCLAK